MTSITTVGYGDIAPESNLERAAAMFALFVGTAYYSCVIGMVSSMVSARERRYELRAFNAPCQLSRR